MMVMLCLLSIHQTPLCLSALSVQSQRTRAPLLRTRSSSQLAVSINRNLEHNSPFAPEVKLSSFSENVGFGYKSNLILWFCYEASQTWNISVYTIRNDFMVFWETCKSHVLYALVSYLADALRKFC